MKNELHVELLPSKLRWYESEIYQEKYIHWLDKNSSL
jgi:hypothetical protein